MLSGMKIGLLIILLAALSTGCEEEFTDCQLGLLRGTWRIQFQEVDGNCGAIADDTIVLNPEAEPSPNCTFHSDMISADRCRSDTDFTCEEVNDLGEVTLSQRWTGVLEHVDIDTLSGTVTIRSETFGGSCQSTYNVTYRRL